VLAVGILAAPAQGARTFAQFVSPSGNIECELSTAAASCLLAHPPFRRAALDRRGHVKICNRSGRCSGDLGEGKTLRLKYGHSIRIGPFKCTSRTTGMTCKVVKTGKGFRINRRGVKRVG
jgi:hypothetical protein